MITWQLRDPRMVAAIQKARESFGPEAEHWPDDEVIHRLLITVLDLRRQIGELKPREPIPPPLQSQYSKL
jgi:hypothetical protein